MSNDSETTPPLEAVGKMMDKLAAKGVASLMATRAAFYLVRHQRESPGTAIRNVEMTQKLNASEGNTSKTLGHLVTAGLATKSAAAGARPTGELMKLFREAGL